MCIRDRQKTEVEDAYDKMKEKLMQELKDTLPPEFLNRIDEIVIFRGLDENDAKKITRVLIEELNLRLSSKGIKLLPTTSVINLIAESGFDKEYGARNIRRKIQELIENPLADFILDNHLVTEDRKESIVKLDKEKDRIKFILNK